MKEAFETLIRKILQENPSAGRGQGSGGVFGAGVEEREPEGSSPGKLKVKSKGAKDASEKKKSKCIIL